MSFTLSKRSRERLEGVHPDLVRVAERAIEITEVDFVITEGVRDLERQQFLYNSGKSKTMNSRHLTGHAVDVMAIGDLDGDGDKDDADAKLRWQQMYYVDIASAFQQASDELGVRIKWGGHWSKFRDSVHFELDWEIYP